MQIYVLSVAAKQFTLEIENSSSTIENVKNVIKNKEEGKELRMDELDLVFQGTILEEGKTLSYYNIQDGSTLNMVFQLRGETVQVILQDTVTGWTWTIENIGESDTLDDLKKKIEDVIGIYPHWQELDFNGTCLKQGVILDQMRLIQSKVLESGDQDTIAGMYKDNGRPTILMYQLVEMANIIHHRVKWADGSSSPPKRSSPAIKIDGVSDDNVMDSNDHASRSSESSSMNQHVSFEKGKRLSFDEEFNCKLNLLAEVDKEVANLLKGDDWDRLTSSLRVVPNISMKKFLDVVDLFEEKPTLIRIFLSLNPQEKEAWLARKLGY